MTRPLWYRSWPSATERTGTLPHVVDNMPKLCMTNRDYNMIEYWPSDDFCLLEWDVALDAQERLEFEGYALREPEKVLTATYRLRSGRFCTDGFGCIYMPQAILRQYLDTDPPLFSDVTFFRWLPPELHRVTWAVHPQHLNT